MKKILMAIMAVFVLAVMVGTVSAVVPPTLTVITVTVYQADSTTVVPSAAVTVTCTHGTDFVRTTTSNGAGVYSVVFPASQCAVGDLVTVEAVSGSADGSNTGTVDHTGRCLVNTGIVNVSIPEFGLIAASVAVVGALGIFIYRRKN